MNVYFGKSSGEGRGNAAIFVTGGWSGCTLSRTWRLPGRHESGYFLTNLDEPGLSSQNNTIKHLTGYCNTNIVRMARGD